MPSAQPPHPGFVSTAPDSANIFQSPSLIALTQISLVVGVIIRGTFTFFPLRTFAAIIKSSYLPFVQEPINAPSISIPSYSLTE